MRVVILPRVPWLMLRAKRSFGYLEMVTPPSLQSLLICYDSLKVNAALFRNNIPVCPIDSDTCRDYLCVSDDFAPFLIVTIAKNRLMP